MEVVVGFVCASMLTFIAIMIYMVYNFIVEDTKFNREYREKLKKYG